jgi:hypothetical protein
MAIFSRNTHSVFSVFTKQSAKAWLIFLVKGKQVDPI